MKPTTNILKETAQIFKAARGYVMEGIPRLYKIREERLYSEHYDSFKDYITQECELDNGQVSRWLTAWNHYVVEGGIEPTQLEKANPEKLYKASKTKGNPALQLSRALTLTMPQLKEQKTEDDFGEHDHIAGNERWAKCETCGSFFKCL